MPKLNEDYREISHTLRGIPCIIALSHYYCEPGDRTTWASDWDYYGYTEMEYRILDRKGYIAPWLEKKIDKYDTREIEARIERWLKDQRDDY